MNRKTQFPKFYGDVEEWLRDLLVDELDGEHLRAIYHELLKEHEELCAGKTDDEGVRH